jgi:hypothetical protein
MIFTDHNTKPAGIHEKLDGVFIIRVPKSQSAANIHLSIIFTGDDYRADFLLLPSL